MSSYSFSFSLFFFLLKTYLSVSNSQPNSSVSNHASKKSQLQGKELQRKAERKVKENKCNKIIKPEDEPVKLGAADAGKDNHGTNGNQGSTIVTIVILYPSRLVK